MYLSEHVTNEIDGLSSSGSSGQRSLSDFELCDPLDERAGSMLGESPSFSNLFYFYLD